MLEERLARAAGALERSVAEVDALQWLQDLRRRRRRQRTVTTALALAVTAAVLAGRCSPSGLSAARPPARTPGPSDPTAPARVVERLRQFGDPVAMAVQADNLWMAGDNPTWVTRWMTPTNPMTRQTPTIALPAAPTRLAVSEDAVWVLTLATTASRGSTRRPIR